MNNTAYPQEPFKPNARQLSVPVKFALGLMGFVLRTASEATRIVGEMHHVIAHRPSPLAKDVAPSIESAPKLYQLLQLAMIHCANQVNRVVPHLPGEIESSDLRRIQSAMNGVFGDKLAEWNHPSAITMSLCDSEENPTTLTELQQLYPNGVAILVHGLCLSEKEWTGASPEAFIESLQSHGVGVARLRYNSGLAISENGALLASLIDQQWENDNDQNLILIGHSMGGLVARSAIFQAEHYLQHGWVQSVSHAAYIASPHEGATLEKLGNYANSILGITPYLKPLMALGNIRSQGIRSLRESNIADLESLDKPTFKDNIHHLLIGARHPDPVAYKLFGDGLVDDISAMGPSHFPDEHERVQRIFINDVGHLKLLQDKRLYWALTLWLSSAINEQVH